MSGSFDVGGFGVSPKMPSAQGEAVLAEVATRVTKARVARRMSMAELAEARSLKPGVIFEIESGRANLSLLTFAKVAAALEVALRDLMPGFPSSTLN